LSQPQKISYTSPLQPMCVSISGLWELHGPGTYLLGSPMCEMQATKEWGVLSVEASLWKLQLCTCLFSERCVSLETASRLRKTQYHCSQDTSTLTWQFLGVYILRKGKSSSPLCPTVSLMIQLATTIDPWTLGVLFRRPRPIGQADPHTQQVYCHQLPPPARQHNQYVLWLRATLDAVSSPATAAAALAAGAHQAAALECVPCISTAQRYHLVNPDKVFYRTLL
jgi:hypothetical protein